MGMLDRYKKKGGFNQLLQLLETSPATKREQFLALIGSESPIWEETLRQKILTINRVYDWEPIYLVEILSRVQPLTLAIALHGYEEEFIERVLGCLPPISKRKINDMMAEANPSPAEKATCISKMLTDVRGFIAQGIIRLEKVDSALMIPENIEEQLNNSFVASSVTTAEFVPSKDAVSSGDGDAVLRQEVDFLKRKLNHVNAELTAIKHENTVLKDKLSQIKKIA